ncbi:MAG TPA: hypothetical protein PK671_26710, partial [Candidatus Obscuribacter sp.]|nr:hypothetical protein [Candidatus Obscuribacter sp.]
RSSGDALAIMVAFGAMLWLSSGYLLAMLWRSSGYALAIPGYSVRDKSGQKWTEVDNVLFGRFTFEPGKTQTLNEYQPTWK